MAKKPKKKPQKKPKLKKNALPDLPAKEGSEAMGGGLLGTLMPPPTFAPPYVPVRPELNPRPIDPRF